jgi:hypothetical protein
LFWRLNPFSCNRQRPDRIFCGHSLPINKSVCNPKPKSSRKAERNPFNVGHNDLANYSSIKYSVHGMCIIQANKRFEFDDGPIIGARVRLAPDPLTPYNHLCIQRTTTDQLGHFSLTNIAPGKYSLTAKPMVSSETTPYKSEPQTLMLTENDHKTIEMKLEKQQK